MTTKAKDGRETLQERLQARIDKHRDPRGNICLGTYNHWDSALDLEAIGSLDAAQAEIARLTKDLQRAEARDSGGHAPDGVTWKHAWMREAEWRGRAVDAANMLIDLCAHADFRNGNTDESQSCDEGERLAAGIIEQAKALLPEQAPLRQPEGWQPTRDQLRPFAARAASHFMDLSGDCPAATIVEGVLDTMLNDWASASQVSPQEAAKAVGAFGDWQFISEARSNPAKTPTPASAVASEAGEDDYGWVFDNPDAGEQYSFNHPTDSGECDDASNIRKATFTEKWVYDAFQEEFQKSEQLRKQLEEAQKGTPVAWQVQDADASWGQCYTIEADAKRAKSNKEAYEVACFGKTLAIRPLYVAITSSRDAGLEEAANAIPCTAENPNESDYERGRFDGIMEYQKKIRALASTPAGRAALKSGEG